ncbi:major facilitator superfamily protein [Candidatus Nitrosoglobus terrae]|uniref:Major facilitator superfamily protein n=1 Tax=Candidatus Nitrosoglobus terrae TaxID=1630141 RepID=A0A1Q2SNP3_9GAMM|nr:MFS transporter [Candidatus Nitrosoglobus terrae]BAW80756.1 major facilitator superfamily protein [Candidatus Nitrosoglobus terrae]
MKKSTSPYSASKAALVSWALYDWASSAFGSIITTFVFAAYFTRQVAENETIGTVQWGNTLGIAGTIVAIGGPILGAIADQAGRRKPWIIVFTLLCVATTGLLWLVKPTPSYTWLALLLVGLGTLGVEFASIFYNAMLPGLSGPEYVGRWSGWGWGIGYAGNIICSIIALLVFIQKGNQWLGLNPDAAEPVRATFLLVSIWYLFFALPLFFITPDIQGTGKSLLQAIRDGMQQLHTSIRQIRHYSPIVRFLIARIFYIEGLATLFTFGGVYAAGTFHMDGQHILIFSITLNITAALGAFVFAWIDDRIGSKPVILLSLIGLMIFSIAILTTETLTLFWAFGLLLGIFVGPVQAASRSFLAKIAPEALRNEMFGLFALSGKVTSFLGPLLVGWITYLSNSQRIGMGVIIIFFFIGFLCMLAVPNSNKQSL